MSGRHLTEDEVVNRVFPAQDGTAPIPIHQAVCPECQERVARLREAFLLDRGALTGVVESYPAEFWNAQRKAVMGRISELAAQEAEEKATPFPARLTRSVLQRPALAFGTLAAALALVAGLTVLRGGSDPSAEPVQTVASAEGAAPFSAADTADDELLRAVDVALTTESPYETVLPEAM
ncbi:MAG: hypothetical protein ACYC4P_02925 [Thermoanaerobaculia bacterium]